LSNNRAIITIISLLFLIIAAQKIRAADGPEDWDNSKYRLYRGNMHIHTWISTHRSDRIDTTISQLDSRTLDFAGMSDYSDEMNDTQWLVNRGACSATALNHMGNLGIHPLPGFEWIMGGPFASASNPDVFHVNVFGEDQLAWATSNTNNSSQNNIPNGEMLNIENPVLDNNAYRMSGLNFYDTNIYRNFGAFPGSTVRNNVVSLYSWIDDSSNDPYGMLIAQINNLRLSDPGVALQSYTTYLDKDLLRNRDRLQKRMCLMEVAAGDSSYKGINDLRHNYNLALCNHWQVAPSEGSDNTGALAGSSTVRQIFLGLWADDNDSRASNPNETAKRMLFALKDKRTFVSENPYITLKFSSSICDARHNPQGGTERKMGDNVLLNSGNGAYAELQFTLTLARQNNAPQDNSRYRVRNKEIKLVRICEYTKDTVAANTTPVNTSDDVTHYFTATTVFKAYNSSNFEGTPAPDLVNRLLQKKTTQSQSEFTIAQNPKSDPAIYDLRDGALTMTCDEYLKPFDYINTNKAVDARVICYYALVKFESGEYAISSPVWTVAKDTF